MTTTIPVLMYHEVSDEPSDLCPALAVRPAAFAEQLRHLHDHGFTPITVSHLAAALHGPATGERPALPRRPVALTFDDGFEDFHRVVLPLLGRFGFPATVFVTTGWLQDAGPAAAPGRPARMLSRSQVAEVAAAGVEVGGHSHSHPQLDQLPGAALDEEVRRCKGILEEVLPAPVTSFAYPFGYSDARVRRTVGQAGYDAACAVANALTKPGSDPFALPRLTVRWATPLDTFGRVVEGERIAMTFLKDRALTKGWAVVRRSRFALNRVRGSA